MDNPSPPQTPTIPSAEVPNPKLNFIHIGLTLIISALIFGTIGYFLGQQQATKPTQLATSNVSEQTPLPYWTPTPAPTLTPPPPTPTPQVTAKTNTLNTYTSTSQKDLPVHFDFPNTWEITEYKKRTYSESSSEDRLTVVSPSQKNRISWWANVDGIGGGPGCSVDVPDSQLGEEMTPCRYEKVESLRVPNTTGIYFISFIETYDGSTYKPKLELQRSSIPEGWGWLLEINEARYALTGRTDFEGTKAEALAWFDTPEAQEAKAILMSLRY